MTVLRKKPVFSLLIHSLIAISLVFSVFCGSVHANEFDDFVNSLRDEYNQLAENINDANDYDKLRFSMMSRQLSVADSFSSLDTRVKALIADDPRKTGAEERLQNAEAPRDNFINKTVEDYIDEDPYRPKNTFNDLERAAVKAINNVNRYLIGPVQPGASGITERGTVPEGDIMEDFIPQFIRLLFRFASLAIFVAFVVSGIMFVIAFDNEERVTKAKQMLYYSLIGFAFVSLAFAIVKAVTDIDFFGFI
ncbi:pilin [candidate division KSB1 bacterium]